MAELNLRWRAEERPTDVLSFPAFAGDAAGGLGALPPGLPGLPPFLGDIVLNLDAIARQAVDELPGRLARLGLGDELPPGGWGMLEEATFLMIHGILHLLGHDHHDPASEARMVAEEARLMAIFLRLPWKRPKR